MHTGALRIKYLRKSDASVSLHLKLGNHISYFLQFPNFGFLPLGNKALYYLWVTNLVSYDTLNRM